MELRQALANYVFRARGINCRPEQIMIISGSTQGLSLISNLLYSKSKEIIVEDPIHYGLLKVISSCGYSINPVSVDCKGMRTDILKTDNDVGFIYVTPSHQFPLGGVLSIQSLNSNFQNEYVVEGEAAGLHLVVQFKNILFTEDILKKISKQKVKAYPVERYAINKGKHNSWFKKSCWRRNS